jgi:hypothetical protein
MGVMGLVFALFTVGYILGVWTAFSVLRRPQRAYEDLGPEIRSSTPSIVLGDTSCLVEKSP